MNDPKIHQMALEILKQEPAGSSMTMAQAMVRARFEDNLSRLPSPDDAISPAEATRIQALEDEYTERYMEELDQVHRLETDGVLAEDQGLKKDDEAQK